MSDKKINVKKSVIYLIFVLLLANIVFGANFNFAPNINPGNLCTGSTGLFVDVITNTGTSQEQFSISTGGSASSFSTTVPQGFSLMPGEAKSVYSYVSPRSSSAIGTYSLNVVANANGDSKSLDHNVQVVDCYNFELSALSAEKHVCPSETQKFDVLVNNKGEFADSYSLKVEGPGANWVTLSEESISVGAKQSKTVFVYVNAPANDVGSKEFTIVVISQGSGRVGSVNLNVIIDPCFNYDISSVKDYVSFCEKGVESLPLTVKNSGSTTNTYLLNLEGPEWASLDSNKITLSKGETGNINVVLNPDYGVEGDFDVNIDIKSEKGNLIASNLFNVNVKKCHSVLVNIEQSSDKICNSLTSKYNVVVKNTGEFEKGFTFELEGPVWSSLDRSFVELGPGEETSLNLEVNPGFGTSAGDYDIKVIVNGMDSSKVMSYDSIVLTTVDIDSCYQPSIGLEKNSLDVHYDSAATIPIIIENKGSKTARYNLAVTGTAANFVELNPATLEIEPDKAELTYMYVAPLKDTLSGSYSATVSVRLDDSTILASEVIDINVLEGMAPEDVIAVEPDVIEQEKGPGFFTRFVDWIKGWFSKDEVVDDIDAEVVDDIDAEVVDEGTTDVEIVEEVVETQPIDLDMLTSTQELVDKNTKVNLVINNEPHSVVIDSFDEKGITLLVESDPIYVPLEVDEVKEIDTDGDGVNDLRITLNGMDGEFADITYEKITEIVEEVDEVIVDDIDAEVVEDTTDVVVDDIDAEVVEDTTEDKDKKMLPVISNTFGFILVYKWYILAGIIILLLLIWFIKTNAFKKLINFFEEEIEDDFEDEIEEETIKPTEEKHSEKTSSKDEEESKEVKKEDKPKVEKKKVLEKVSLKKKDKPKKKQLSLKKDIDEEKKKDKPKEEKKEDDEEDEYY